MRLRIAGLGAFLAAAVGFAVHAGDADGDDPDADLEFDMLIDELRGPRFDDIVEGLANQALPPGPFRIYARGSKAEYRPRRMNETHTERRNQMIDLLTAPEGHLARGLHELAARTRRNRLEHGAFILSDGRLGETVVGTINYVDVPEERPADAVGFVHTHPRPCDVITPPSGNDHGMLSFPDSPLQLVIEAIATEPPAADGRCYRVWGVLEPRHATLLGYLEPESGFRILNAEDPTSERAYAIIDEDQLSMEQLFDDDRRERERRERRSRIYSRPRP